MSYLTIKQAAAATNKSEKTIRRLCGLSKSKAYITYEGSKLLIDANYLQQNYPMATSRQPGQNSEPNPRQQVNKSTLDNVDTTQHQNAENLQHEIDLLKLQLKHKEEIIHIKDRQLEVLERSLLLLGEGSNTNSGSVKVQEPQSQTTPQEQPVKSKRWWFW